MGSVIPMWIVSALIAYAAIRSAFDGDVRDAFEIGALAALMMLGAFAKTRRLRGRAAFFAEDGRPPRSSG
jgi:hypothetical protein